MRKSPIWRGELLIYCLLTVLVFPPALLAQNKPSSGATDHPNNTPRYSSLIHSQIERLEAELARTRTLVENGTLAPVRLKELEASLADAKDEEVLAETLYGDTPVEKFTEQQGKAMMDAAQRRVDRESAVVQSRQSLLDNGVISRSDFETLKASLDTRRQVLVLAQNRLRLLEDLRRMAEAEKRAELAAAGPQQGTLKNSMVRYVGNGAFTMADVPVIANQFEQHFHHPLPISASGQTLLHQSLGLDHRNRIDVALGPESAEGVWLRSFLEKLHIPYLAFSNAVPGAATAPHIHIGVESTRLHNQAGG